LRVALPGYRDEIYRGCLLHQLQIDPLNRKRTQVTQPS
jgi:hypothetical protein